jgi:glutamate racemase
MSVLRHVRRHLPDVDLVYLADRARAPYGRRSLAEVQGIALANTELLLAAGAEQIVVACNTASAAALHRLRQVHPDVQFVGMEPAVKPAIQLTRSGVIGVLATDTTFQGDLFASLLDRFAGEVEVLAQPCPGWADLVEAGRVTGPEVEGAVKERIKPLMAQGADVLVLGCTHYPFLTPIITRVSGPGVTVVDPGDAVARQACRLAGGGGGQTWAGRFEVMVTGSTNGFDQLVAQLIGWEIKSRPVTLS